MSGPPRGGLWHAKSSTYDVIVLDLRLLRLDGLTVLRRLRAGGISTHILILTAKDTASDRVNGLDCGADDYLIKPFDFAEFLARVRALVRREYRNKNPCWRWMTSRSTPRPARLSAAANAWI